MPRRRALGRGRSGRGAAGANPVAATASAAASAAAAARAAPASRVTTAGGTFAGAAPTAAAADAATFSVSAAAAASAATKTGGIASREGGGRTDGRHLVLTETGLTAAGAGCEPSGVGRGGRRGTPVRAQPRLHVQRLLPGDRKGAVGQHRRLEEGGRRGVDAVRVGGRGEQVLEIGGQHGDSRLLGEDAVTRQKNKVELVERGTSVNILVQKLPGRQLAAQQGPLCVQQAVVDVLHPGAAVVSGAGVVNDGSGGRRKGLGPARVVTHLDGARQPFAVLVGTGRRHGNTPNGRAVADGTSLAGAGEERRRCSPREARGRGARGVARQHARGGVVVVVERQEVAVVGVGVRLCVVVYFDQKGGASATGRAASGGAAGAVATTAGGRVMRRRIRRRGGEGEEGG